MSTDLAIRHAAPAALQMPSADDLNTIYKNAGLLLKSGLLPDSIKTPEAAFAIIQKGRELGLPPMAALSGIVIIKGKPGANAETMAALVYRDHGDNALRITETTNDHCTIVHKRREWPASEAFTFDLDDAKKAGLLSSGPWEKYPKAMLRARCISAVARMSFSDSINGLYTPEELGANVSLDAEGTQTVVHEVVSAPAHQIESSPATHAYIQKDGRTVDLMTGVVVESEEDEVDELKAAQQAAGDACARYGEVHGCSPAEACAKAARALGLKGKNGSWPRSAWLSIASWCDDNARSVKEETTADDTVDAEFATPALDPSLTF